MFDYRSKSLFTNSNFEFSILFGIKFLYRNYSCAENLHFLRILKLNFITHINLNGDSLI